MKKIPLTTILLVSAIWCRAQGNFYELQHSNLLSQYISGIIPTNDLPLSQILCVVTSNISGGAAASPTNWPWSSITNQPIIPSTNGFVTAIVTNGFVASNITNGLATTNYVNASTNGFVGAGIITGLATTAYVVAATNGLGSAAFTAA